jgi:DUF4097 and DUF4098 domain-containing protein YvlB
MRPRLLLIVGLGLLAAGPAVAETWREQSRKSIPAQGLDRLVVSNPRGRIEARGIAGSEVRVTALKIARGRSESEAREAARQTQVELSREGRQYAIRVRYPKTRSVNVNIWDGFSDIPLPRVEVRLVIEVPSRLGLELETASADVLTEAVDGDQAVRTASGDVSVEAAGGAVEVRTASGDVGVTAASSLQVSTSSGDVEAGRVAGPVVVTTSSGDVSVPEARDSIRVVTVSGDVAVQQARGGATVRSTSGEVVLRRATGYLSISTVSGQVQAGVEPPLRRASLATGSGDIRLDLAHELGCTLDLQTTSGSIDLEIPVRTRSVSRHHVTAVVGGGASPVSLRSTSGSITVTSGEP